MHALRALDLASGLILSNLHLWRFLDDMPLKFTHILHGFRV